MNYFIQQPFVQGLMLGLLFSCVVFLYGWNRQRYFKTELKTEREKSKNSLADTAEAMVSAKGQLRTENDVIKEENDRLKASFSKLIERPDKDELRKIYLYETALDSMKIGAPGFVAAWDKYLNDANLNLTKVKGGKLIFIRNKIIQILNLPTKTSILSVDPDQPSS